ncbi:MAG: permease, partial [Pseudomonadota bacterium]
MEMVFGVIRESWNVLNESALYCLLGIIMSGVLKSFISDAFVMEHLGTNTMSSVVKASLLGIPLPLCSCGVIPVAMGLRRQGAGKGPTTAFLISTPETGIDSIALTYALLDPLMTIVRPVAAFITATVAGMLVNFMPDGKEVRTVNAGAGLSSS